MAAESLLVVPNTEAIGFLSLVFTAALPKGVGAADGAPKINVEPEEGAPNAFVALDFPNTDVEVVGCPKTDPVCEADGCPNTDAVDLGFCPKTDDDTPPVLCPKTEPLAAGCPNTEEDDFVCPKTEAFEVDWCPNTEAVDVGCCPNTEAVAVDACLNTEALDEAAAKPPPKPEELVVVCPKFVTVVEDVVVVDPKEKLVFDVVVLLPKLKPVEVVAGFPNREAAVVDDADEPNALVEELLPNMLLVALAGALETKTFCATGVLCVDGANTP